MDKIDRDTAEFEFDRWAEAMRFDLETDGRDENDKGDILEFRRKIVREIQGGNAVVEDDGVLIFTPEGGGGPFKFSKPNAGVLLALDKKKSTANVAQSNAMLAAITKSLAVHFTKIDLEDHKICLAILALFLG